MSQENEKKQNELPVVDASSIIWVYGGILCLGELPRGEDAKKRLFQKIGFQFDTDWSNSEGPKFRTIDPPFPMDDPAKYVEKELEKLIQEKKPYAVVVTRLYGGSNLADVGAKLAQDFPKENTLATYQKVTVRHKIPFFYVSENEIWPD